MAIALPHPLPAGWPDTDMQKIDQLPSTKYRKFGVLYHVRAIVDDQVIVRTWSRRRGWIYSAVPLFILTDGAPVEWVS